ncbi:MAG: DUF480 domain-containing protein [Planctomycetes bacterium]|nr:DUF480 domain-containing protein [Planctomycetota bacterium]
MVRLDRTGQRIVGVLVEKQLTVPDTYPLTENALVLGCNQSNNRDPVMALEPFQVAGALMALQQQDVVKRVEGGGRVAKFRHDLEAALQLGKPELAVLAELLLRGPQAPGALKPRVLRMGYHAEPEAIEQLLRGLAARSPALVELLPLGPRERDRRWRHLLGDGSEPTGAAASAAVAASPSAPAAGSTVAPLAADLEVRVRTLEQRVAELERRLREPGSPPRCD